MEQRRSVDQWIDDQPWTDAMKAAAHEVHAARSRSPYLNPLTLGQWIAWAERQS